MKALPFVAACLVAAPAALPAQNRWPVSVELAIGQTWGTSNDNARFRGDRSGAHLNLLLGARLHRPDRPGLLLALDATVRGVNTTITTDCRIAPDGGCVPWFPGLGGASLLAGWESRSTSVRFLAGPGIMSANYHRVAGFTGRFDLAAPLVSRASALLSLSGLWVPSWRGDRFVYLSIAGGIRLR